MNRTTTRNAYLLALAAALTAAASASADDLKTTRVSLFSSGVGYFESAATVEGDAAAELQFRTDQINDILKSLVLRDLDGGTIAAVQYPSRDPIEKALRSFGVDITGKPTLAQLLDQLRGVPVVIEAPNPVQGLILGVEKRTMKIETGSIERDVLTLSTDAGLRSFVLAEVSSVKIADAKVQEELTKALKTLATSKDADKKTVSLSFTGQGKRRVRVSYLLETPVWKTSYRLVLDKEKKPYMQGWAIVENATEQDWEAIQLSLVSGRPISFIMDLYQPLYVSRPVEELELYRSLRPPMFEGAIPPPAAPARGGLTLGRRARDAGERAKEAPMAADAMMLAAPEESEGMNLAGSGVAATATAQQAGELFEYQISTPVSMKRRQSAMLPIVGAEAEGTKLSIYNPASHAKHPMNGLRFKNTTGLHLMQGPVTVFDGGTYAGDAKLPDLRAGEERLLAYALDLGVEVDVKAQPQPQEEMRLWIAKGTLHHRRKLTDQRVYTVNNKDAAAKTVLIEQRIDEGWDLVAPDKPEERSGAQWRFKVEAAPKQSTALTVRLERPIDEVIVLSNLGLDRIELYLRSRVISEAVRGALQKVIELRRSLDDVTRQIAELTRAIEEITAEQNRIRENMGRLSQTSDVYRRYEKKLDTQETQIEEAREKIAGLRQQETQRRKALEDYLMGLNVE